MTTTTQHPAVLTTEEAARLFGCTTAHLWQLARDGKAPIEPLRLGRSLRWPKAKVLEVLGLKAAP